MAVPGFSATTDVCPRCRTEYLLVFHTSREPRTIFVKAAELTGRSVDALRAALAGVPHITNADIDFMLAVALPPIASVG